MESNSAKRNVLFLALCQALMLSATSLIITSAALIGADLAADKRWATLPLSIQFLGMMTAVYPASMIMKRIGRKNGFVLGLAAGLGGALVNVWAIIGSNFVLFCLGSFCIGLFNGFGQYYRFAAADLATDEFRSRAISWVLAGGVGAAFLGPNLARLSMHWIPGAVFAGGYIAVLLLYAASLLLITTGIHFQPQTAQERSGSGRPLFVISRQPKFIAAVLGATVSYGVMNLIMTATPLAMRVHGHGFGDTAFVIQWHVFSMFAPSFFTGSLIQRFGANRIISAGAVLLLACAVINLTGVAILHFSVSLVLLGLGWNFMFVSGTALVTECHRLEEKAKTQGVNDLIVFTTVTFTALGSGLLHHIFGWQAINIGVLPFILAVLVMTLKNGHQIQGARTSPSTE